MKKRLLFAMMGAIALTGSMVLSSCSSEDEVADVNPTYNSVTNEVTTEFVLNVPSAAQQTTRMSSDAVQRNSNFLGMQDAHLISLSTGKSTWLAPFAGSTTGYEVVKNFDLGTLYGTSAVTAANNSTSSSRRVLQLALQLKTDAMLTYARAIPGSDPNESGKVDWTVGDTPDAASFKLVSRIGSRSTEFNQTSALACKILNRIVESEIDAVAAGGWTRNGYTNKAALDAISWKQMAEKTSLTPLEEILKKAYNTLTTIPTGEYRAGSASAISSTAYYIWSACNSVFTATATNDGELLAQRLAQEIIRRIGNYFDDYEVSETAIEFLNISDIKANMMQATGMTSEAFDAAYGLVQHGDLKAFPTSFGLPLGVSLLNWTDGTGFSHILPPTSLLDKNATLAVTNYMYPSELFYFGNSALRVSSAEKAVSDYPNGTTPWETDGSWTGWTTGAVNSSTRAVAVKNNINYGVAMLQTKVTLDGTSFSDNTSGVLTGQSDQTLTADEVKNMKLTGVLIGGQNCEVGWNYLAKTPNNSDNWAYVIYDSKINGTGAIPTPSGEENYTLVFDNYNSTLADNAQSDVYIALEFQNNAKDFYGVGNMIRYGGTFYLVGKLTRANATNLTGTNALAWPTTYAIPPYTDAGGSTEAPRVFIQDYMTTANFKIGANSLKNAFVTVPDLRSSQTSLGLSVDLNWKTGLDFVTVLGN